MGRDGYCAFTVELVLYLFSSFDGEGVALLRCKSRGFWQGERNCQLLDHVLKNTTLTQNIAFNGNVYIWKEKNYGMFTLSVKRGC